MYEQIATFAPGILLAYSAFLLAIISPGPNMLAVIGTSMGSGRASGIAVAMGISAGSFTWAVLTAIGLSAILATYPHKNCESTLNKFLPALAARKLVALKQVGRRQNLETYKRVAKI